MTRFPPALPGSSPRLCPVILVKLRTVPSMPNYYIQISQSAFVAFSQSRRSRMILTHFCQLPSFSSYSGPGFLRKQFMISLYTHLSESVALIQSQLLLLSNVSGRPCSTGTKHCQPLPLHWCSTSSVQAGCCDTTLKETWS